MEIAASQSNHDMQYNRSVTPLPDEAFGSMTPAWDPLHVFESPDHADQSGLEFLPGPHQVSPSTITCGHPIEYDHILLKNSLVGAQLIVKADGGSFCNEEIFVEVYREDQGILSLRQFTTRSKQMHTIDARLISPTHPSVKHDIGLLVIIEGTHCGKFARRVHHRNNNLIVTVVARNEESPDTIVGDEIELNQSDICIAYETKKQKNMNRSLMKKARDIYVSTHLPS